MSHTDFEAYKKESKKFIHQLREHQAVMDSLSAERFELQEKLAKTERELAQQKNRFAGDLQNELSKNEAILNSQLKSVNQRRQEIATAETNKRNSLQSTIGNQILALNTKISSQNQRESDEKNNAIDALQDSHIQMRLRSRSIANATIPGISTAFKSRLIAAGITTAADVDWRVRHVSGIGPVRQAALMGWRYNLEVDARRSAPMLSAQDRSAIESKYRQERQNLEMEKNRLQTELNAQIANARQYFADMRQSLSQEERQLCSGDVYEKDRIQKQYDARFAEMEAALNSARNQVAPAMAELSEKFRTAQKQVFAIRWKSAKHENEGRRFASLRFRDYLRKLILV